MPKASRRWRFLKTFPARVEEIATDQASGKPLGIWFADEARVGQKNKITRRWASAARARLLRVT
jgi:hypothetical protein